MRRAASILIVLVVAGCGSLQSIAVTPQQRLFAAHGDYVTYGEIAAQAVEDPLTLPETKATLREINRRIYRALVAAQKLYEAGELTDAAVLVAEIALRELRAELIRQGRVTQ